MKGMVSMKSFGTTWVRAIATIALGFCLAACTRNAPPVPETEYPAKIVGSWQGTVGNMRETMAIDGDGTFVCQLYPGGFIARTLSQGVAGSVHGTWNITGNRIALSITGAEHEHVENPVSSSTIIAFKENELTLKSGSGEISAFQRTGAL